MQRQARGEDQWMYINVLFEDSELQVRCVCVSDTCWPGFHKLLRLEAHC